MNEKITLPSLVQMHALASGNTKKQSEDFIKELFNVVTEALIEGEQVKIKSLGVFKTVSVTARKSVNVSTGEEYEIPAHHKVVFVPNKDVAALINEPFEMFETVELNNEVIFEESEKKGSVVQDEVPINHENDAEAPVQTDEESSVLLNDPNVIQNNTDIIEQEIALNIQNDTSDTQDNALNSQDESLNNHDSNYQESSQAISSISHNIVSPAPIRINPKSNVKINKAKAKEAKVPKRRFGLGFVLGFISATLIGIFTLLVILVVDWSSMFNYVNSLLATEKEIEKKEAKLSKNIKQENSISNPKNENIISSDSEEVIESVPTTPSDQIVYDEISTTRYLTTMAKDHYGNFHLWPYIYIENKSFLGHPDRIKPGTKVVIPPLSKYGVNADNPQDIEKAKQLGVEIYSKYK